MAATPETLLLHTAETSHWVDVDALSKAIREAIPGIDLRIARTPPQSRAGIGTARIVVATDVPADLVEGADHLGFVQALSAGVDFWDLDPLRERGIALATAAGVHAEAIAEQVLGYLLAFERGIHTGIRQQERRSWEWYHGGEIREKTVGIVGVGAIGTRVAEYAQAFDMRVIGTKRDTDAVPDAVDEIYDPADLFEILPESDYLVVACPLTPETRQVIDREAIGALPDHAVVVNIARGEIVEEAALVRALQQRKIRGAGLDVYATEPLPRDSPLWDLSNVIMTPHMGGTTPRKPTRTAAVFAQNYEAFVEGNPDGYVNRVF